jgi:amiloride-sensitive sodium channel
MPAESGNMSVKRNTLIFFCRVLWVIVVVIGLVGASFMVTTLWARYVGTQTRTSVETNHYPAWRLPFPAITLCNSNRIFRSKAEALVSEL